MSVEYVDFETAKVRDGLRMIVVSGIPSPWGEAAKGIFQTKKLPFVAVRYNPGDHDAVAWSGGHKSAPVVVYNDEAPRWDWQSILLLAERLAPAPALLPADTADRALVFGLAHEICGEMGLGWCRRNSSVRSGLAGGPGFPEPIARYLAGKYGYREEEGALYDRRVVDILTLLSARLKAQREAGSKYYVGNSLTALDIYSATFMVLFGALPEEHCPMPPPLREGFSAVDDTTKAALDPILREHRQYIYETHLELPLSL